MPKFDLHPQLAKDCIMLGQLHLCQVLLMNDSQYPWLILVPRRANIREVFELSADEQSLLWQEASHCGQALMALERGLKLNLAALGNMVEQLHIHLVVRHAHDPAWPKPVWGQMPAKAYSADQLSSLIPRLQDALGLSRQLH